MTHRAKRVLEDGVIWRPRHDPHYIVAGMRISGREAPAIAVLQEVLAGIEAQLQVADGPFGYGVLTGRHCRCPRTDRAYLLVDALSPCPPLDGEADDYSLLALRLGERVTELEHAGRTVVGYYRGAAQVVPRPSYPDVGLLRTLFPEPWQLMLVREEGPPATAGAIVRVEPIAAQAYASSFIELLPRRHARRNGHALSVIAWNDYHPSEPVLPRPVEQRVARSTAARLRSFARELLFGRAEPEPERPPRRAARAANGRTGAVVVHEEALPPPELSPQPRAPMAEPTPPAVRAPTKAEARAPVAARAPEWPFAPAPEQHLEPLPVQAPQPQRREVPQPLPEVPEPPAASEPPVDPVRAPIPTLEPTLEPVLEPVRPWIRPVRVDMLSSVLYPRSGIAEVTSSHPALADPVEPVEPVRAAGATHSVAADTMADARADERAASTAARDDVDAWAEIDAWANAFAPVVVPPADDAPEPPPRSPHRDINPLWVILAAGLVVVLAGSALL